MKQALTPSIEDLCLDYVLIQAWKKTAAYLRSHSWYADTLELDYQSLRLPHFIKEIQERLRDPENWQPKPIRLVPAPKNQQWAYRDGKWEPRPHEKVDKKIRPLAHVDIQDQVVATAIMLCLADRVETATGNPCISIKLSDNRKEILAYGHRLVCDQGDNNQLYHRWGSSKLYRQYYQDYRTFLERPKLVAKQLTNNKKSNPFEDENYEIAIVQSDISKFYDNISPQLLWEKLSKYNQGPEEDAFFGLARRIFDWRWANADKVRIKSLASKQGVANLDLVALPQGLVTAGFFANIVLSDFDMALKGYIGKELQGTGIFIEDACYYVDDLRIVLRIPKGLLEAEIEKVAVEWIQGLLDEHANGLQISSEKTEVTVEERDKQFLVKQSSEADRIQHQVSGVFDMQHGTEIIAAIEGFFRTQQRYSLDSTKDTKIESGLLVGIPDMKDETAARFAAGKFRRTFRSLRPLLNDEIQSDEYIFDDETNADVDYDRATFPQQLILTKQQLDERAKLFSALLIEEWIKNPGNVRLLRIALDLYPDKEFLELVLKVLRNAWDMSAFKGARREVRLYCLAELFRAGATETGVVRGDECLTGNLSIQEYHDVLIAEAHSIVNEYIESNFNKARFPWYLMQQVLLYLGARNAFPNGLTVSKTKGTRLLSRYWELAEFLSGKTPKALEPRAILLVMAKTGFGIEGFDFLGQNSRISAQFLREVDSISPKVARDVWIYCRENANRKLYLEAQRLGFEDPRADDIMTLARVSAEYKNPFMDEENLLELADWLFENHYYSSKTITPWDIVCEYDDDAPGYEFGHIRKRSLRFQKASGKKIKLFESCNWCETDEEHQKYQIGLLLRFAILGSTGFYDNYSSAYRINKQPRYSKPISHWEQQRYSTVQARSALGPPWLPISSFTEDLLFELLRWPGCGLSTPYKSIGELRLMVKQRLAELYRGRGRISSVSFLEQRAPWLNYEVEHAFERPLRIGIIQTIIPDSSHYEAHVDDPCLLRNRSLRSKQKRHLATVMQGVSQMLRVRETHIEKIRNDGGIVDLLIFPELAIHPDDIDTLILPFSRSHRCMMLFGQVYHPKDNRPKSPLINSCLWMIPETTATDGLQIRIIEQGKKNLMQLEDGLVPKPEGFRPAQWLIKYEWSRDINNPPLTLSASVCYDATDLALAADLRSKSDLYIVCALNRDVGTFDRMSESLHYHMYQGIIIVNNGKYGGSSFFMPFKDTYNRQVLQLHGQSQVLISFVEISPEKLINRSEQSYFPNMSPPGTWKTPPAGWKDSR